MHRSNSRSSLEIDLELVSCVTLLPPTEIYLTNQISFKQYNTRNDVAIPRIPLISSQTNQHNAIIHGFYLHYTSS